MFIFKVIKKVWILVVLIFISLFYSFDNCNYHPKNNELKNYSDYFYNIEREMEGISNV